MLKLLAVAFIVMKIVHVIDWSWVWVLAPIWGSVVLTMLLFFIASFTLL